MSRAPEVTELQPLVLKVDEVAFLLNLSTRAVWREVSKGRLPKPLKFGRSSRWSRTQIEAVVEAKAQKARSR